MNLSPRFIVVAFAGCLLAGGGWVLFKSSGSGEDEQRTGSSKRSSRSQKILAEPPAGARSSSSGRFGAAASGNGTNVTKLRDPSPRAAAATAGKTARPAFMNLLREATEAEDPAQRDTKLREAILQMRAEDGPDSYRFVRDAMIKGGSVYNVDGMWRDFWVQYGKVDVAGALALAENDSSEYNQKDRVRKHLYSGWGQENPAEALARLNQDESLPERGRGIEGISAVWAETDPEGATAWALANLTGAFQATALGAIQWGTLTARGATGAVDLFAALPRTPEADGAVGALGVSLSQTPGIKPAERQYAAEVIRDRGLYNDTLLHNVAGDLMQSGPPQTAADYMTGFQPPEKGQLYRPLLTVMDQWARNDPIAAGNWANAQSGKAWFDTAAAGYARAIRTIDPDASAAWVARIRSDEIQNQFR